MQIHMCVIVLLYTVFVCTLIVHPLQESINWSFTEVAISPLPVIDVIDKNVSSVSACNNSLVLYVVT